MPANLAMQQLAQIFANLAARAQAAGVGLAAIHASTLGERIDSVSASLGGLRVSLAPLASRLGDLFQALGQIQTVRQFTDGLKVIGQGLGAALLVPVALAAAGTSRALSAAGGFAI